MHLRSYKLGLRALTVGFALAACGGTTSGTIDDPNAPGSATESPPASSSAPSPSATSTATTGDGPSAVANSSPPASAAEAFFEANVYPSLDPTCGASECHGARGANGFFTASASSTYVQFKTLGFAANAGGNQLLEKGTHEGPALSATQSAFVAQWIALENP